MAAKKTKRVSKSTEGAATKEEKADRKEAAARITTDTVSSYLHPETGAEVVDVECPKHPKMKGHIVTSQLGVATCGTILKSHKEPFEESVDGKTVKGTRTKVDEECRVLLVPSKNKKKTAATSGNVVIHADENLAAPGEVHHVAEGSSAGLTAAEDREKRAKAAGTHKVKPKHPDAA